MKFRVPDYLENVTSPLEGARALQKMFPGKIIVGVDEVGRGPLAGPVVACAAVLKNLENDLGLDDSKKFTRKKREILFDKVKEACTCYAIASASVSEIDALNILNADFLAMRRALAALGMSGLEAPESEIPVDACGTFLNPDDILVVVDGNMKIREVPEALQLAVTRGDGRVASVSAASILAKVFRDRYMERMAQIYPEYGFERNAGYGTREHLEAIRQWGFTPIHRRSFHPKGLD